MTALNFETDHVTYEEILGQNLARHIRSVDGFDCSAEKKSNIYFLIVWWIITTLHFS